ncbi:MAG: hypothetical protein AAGD25_13930 [Cyanobacteria bacterium P01_F01_bin.150]
MTTPTFHPFLIGCIGALAPEIIRLYKLRTSPAVRWSWDYLLVSIPFVLLGGFMAYILEPTSNYAAFYTGVSTPFIVSTLAKESEREAQAIQLLTKENTALKADLNSLQQNQSAAAPDRTTRPPESQSSTPDTSSASNHSALRGIGPTPAVLSFPSKPYSPNGYFPQPQSRRFRPRPSKWTILQTFFKAL